MKVVMWKWEEWNNEDKEERLEFGTAEGRKLGFYAIGWGVSRTLGIGSGEQGECGGGLRMV